MYPLGLVEPSASFYTDRIDECETRVTAQIDVVLDLPNAPDNVTVELLHVRKELEFADSDDVEIGTIRPNLEAEAIDKLVETVLLTVDELVVGARRQSPVGKDLFGSVAQSVTLDTK